MMDTWMQKLREKIAVAIGNVDGIYFDGIIGSYDAHDALVDAVMKVVIEHLEDHEAFEDVVQSESLPHGAPTSTEIIDEDRGEY
jgi:hypothetical protein